MTPELAQLAEQLRMSQEALADCDLCDLDAAEQVVCGRALAKAVQVVERAEERRVENHAKHG
jgi:hypothetical protein